MRTTRTCFPLLDDDDDELGFDELFGGNSFDELLTDSADLMCETNLKTLITETNQKTNLTLLLTTETFRHFWDILQENRNKNTVKKNENVRK